MFVGRCLSVCPFPHLAIVMFVLWLTDSDYSFSNIKLFIQVNVTFKDWLFRPVYIKIIAWLYFCNNVLCFRNINYIEFSVKIFKEMSFKYILIGSIANCIVISLSVCSRWLLEISTNKFDTYFVCEKIYKLIIQMY